MGELLRYSFADTPFGEVVVASSEKGVCALTFAESRDAARADLHARFPHATLREEHDAMQRDVLGIFEGKAVTSPLDLRGTPFQLQVWKALQKIPAGQTSTYGKIAAAIGRPTACRAVGAAVGRNPVAFLVPCHRVLPMSGALGNYHWGPERKAQMLAWEAARRAA